VDAVGSYGQGYIRAGVDEKIRSPFPVLSSGFRSPQDSHGFSCERFQVSRRQIFFAKLEEIDAGTRRFRNLAEKLSALGGFIPRELAAIRDVAKKRRTRHRSFSLLRPPTATKALLLGEGQRLQFGHPLFEIGGDLFGIGLGRKRHGLSDVDANFSRRREFSA
jgi:hypothetical protein